MVGKMKFGMMNVKLEIAVSGWFTDTSLNV